MITAVNLGLGGALAGRDPGRGSLELRFRPGRAAARPRPVQRPGAEVLVDSAPQATPKARQSRAAAPS